MQIKVSDNSDLVKDIRKKIRDNGGYCISKPNKSEDTKCICMEFLERKELGKCRCGLYIRIE